MRELESEAAETRRISEERYRAFLEESAEGIWCYEADEPMPVSLAEDEQIEYFYGTGRLVECNASFARMYGFDSPEQIIGARIGDLLPRDDPRNVEYLRAFIRSDYRLTDAESHELDREGRSRYFVNTLIGIVRDGHITSVWGTQRDITASRNAEEAHRRQTTYFRELFERSPNAILIVGGDDTVRDANHSFERLFGYSADEIRGKAVNELIVPEELAGSAAGLTAQAMSGQVVRCESVRCRRDGTRIIVSLLGYPIVVDGKMEAIYAIYSDITERVRANEAIRQMARGFPAGSGQDFFRSLVQHLASALGVDTAFVGSFVPGSERRAINLVLWHNGESTERQQCRVEGSPCQAVLAEGMVFYERGLRALFPQNDLARQMHAESFLGAPLANASGEPVGVIGVMNSDPIHNEPLARSVLQIFTARAATEFERLRTEEALRQSEEQLQQSQKMEAVGRLAGGIAHDFNNLLTAISGYSDLLLLKIREDSPLRRHVEEIRKAGDRAAALTRQLLAFSRKQVLQTKLIDINAIVIDLERMFRRLIGEDIDLTTRLAPGLGQVRADPHQIEQVILNLVVNARDAMPGGGRLEIETSSQGSYEGPRCTEVCGTGRNFVMLTIRDTGVGMDESVKAHMFEPFFTTKEKGKGTGLGLSTVYGIVRQSGGYVCVDSAPGRGTTFRICLPVAESPADGFHAAPQMQVNATNGTETLLLVEDEEQVRAIAKEVLLGCGYNVIEAASGEEALDTLGKHAGPLQLLLTDIVMPGMNGFELGERLLAERPGLKVLYVSGHTGDSIGLRMSELPPGTAFLQKPFSPDLMTRTVRGLLDLKV